MQISFWNNPQYFVIGIFMVLYLLNVVEYIHALQLGLAEWD